MLKKDLKLQEIVNQMVDYNCDICGFQLEPIHCKLVCFNCGFKRDCSDP